MSGKGRIFRLISVYTPIILRAQQREDRSVALCYLQVPNKDRAHERSAERRYAPLRTLDANAREWHDDER
jgi:hypothetical protein